jgi:RNA recognition motif-containing protein
LSYSTQEESLKEHFKSCGGIQSARIPTQPDSGRPRGFAFSTFLHFFIYKK